MTLFGCHMKTAQHGGLSSLASLPSLGIEDGLSVLVLVRRLHTDSCARVAPVRCAFGKLTGNGGANRGLNDVDVSFVGIVGLDAA